MSQCKRCGSYAINHHAHGRDGSDPDLCDVCYWRSRAEQLNAVPVEARGDMLQGGKEVKHPTDKLLTLLGQKTGLAALTGQDRADVLAYGRAVWEVARCHGFAAAMDAARDMPRNTCGTSRHAQQIAERLLAGEPVGADRADAIHAGESIASVVAALWQVRTEHAQQAETIRVLRASGGTA